MQNDNDQSPREGEAGRLPPTVTIGLGMRNAAGTIATALRSLERQTFTDWELILIDDGSTDDGVTRAFRELDARGRLLADGRRLGLAARLNQALDLARGRCFARMDADDIAYPERLARQVAFLDAHPQVDLLGTGMMIFGPAGRPLGLYPARATHADICARPWSGFYLAHPSWMGRTAWFRRWRYDARCRKAQDQDLLLRAYSRSRFAALTEPLVGYRQDAVSLRKSVLGRYYFSRAIAKTATRDGAYSQGALAVAEQAAKLALDAVAIATGFSRQLLKHRLVPFDAAQAARWQAVWSSCCGERSE